MAIIWTKLIPRWGGDTIEPPEAKKDTGYIAGDKPPAKWENWLRKGTYEALDETRDVIEGIDSQLAQIELDVTDLIDHKSIHSSGNNANGSWVRFQDGTQICYGQYNETVTTSLSGVTHQFSSVARTFPSSFTTINSLHVSALNSRFIGFGERILNNSAFNIQGHFDSVQSGVSIRFDWLAIGRWK